MDKAEIRRLYDAAAPSYDRAYQTPRAEAEEWLVQKAVAWTVPERPRTLRILDLGCGTGLGLRLIGWTACAWATRIEYHGVDLSTGMLSRFHLTPQLQEAREMNRLRVSLYYERDMESMLANDISLLVGPVDVVLALFGVVSYAEDPQLFLANIHRVLRPRGRAVLMAYGPSAMRSPLLAGHADHARIMKRTELEWLAEACEMHVLEATALSFLGERFPTWTPEWLAHAWHATEAWAGRHVPGLDCLGQNILVRAERRL